MDDAVVKGDRDRFDVGVGIGIFVAKTTSKRTQFELCLVQRAALREMTQKADRSTGAFLSINIRHLHQRPPDASPRGQRIAGGNNPDDRDWPAIDADTAAKGAE